MKHPFKNTLSYLGVATITFCGVSSFVRANDSVSSPVGDSVSVEHGLELARQNIIENRSGSHKDVTPYHLISLDPNTWGKHYWGFVFPNLSTNEIFYVHKQSEFVQASVNLDTKRTTNSITDVASVNVTGTTTWLDLALPEFRYSKVEQEGAYFVTVQFGNKLQTLAGTFDLIMRIHEGNDRPHPPYYYPEHKVIGRVHKIENMRSATFVISKADLRKYEYVCPWFIGPNAGGGSSFTINQIPSEPSSAK